MLFLDNLSVHKTRAVQEVYRELDLTPLFNAPYSPQYNGIESYWFLLKQVYKKLLLTNMIKGRNLCVRAMIRTAIETVEQAKVISCCRDGIRHIESIE